MTALVVVDVQKDFCEGGALGVEGGNAVAEKIAHLVGGGFYNPVFFTKDWHKPWPDTNGGHFSENPDFVDTWPVHCVEYTEGAKFHPAIIEAISEQADAVDERIRNLEFRKGNGRPDYSGVQAFNVSGVYLADALREEFVDKVDVVGIAGDYCVKATAVDLKRRGFDVRILPEFVASVRGEAGTNEGLDALDAASGPVVHLPHDKE